MPVEASVAAVFCPTRLAFPMPVTMTPPVQSWTSLAAFTMEPSSRSWTPASATASSRRTRRANASASASVPTPAIGDVVASEMVAILGLPALPAV